MIDLNAIEHLATLLDKKDDEMVLQMTLQALVAIVESGMSMGMRLGMGMGLLVIPLPF